MLSSSSASSRSSSARVQGPFLSGSLALSTLGGCGSTCIRRPLFLLELAVQRHHHHHHHHHQNQNQNQILHRWERAPPTWENHRGKNISLIASTLQLSFFKIGTRNFAKKNMYCTKLAAKSLLALWEPPT